MKKNFPILILLVTTIVVVIVFINNSKTVASPVDMVAEREAVLLDVRTSEEWDEGHAQYAELFELSRLENGELPNLNTDATIYVYCRSGNRAEIARNILNNAGFQNITNIGGLDDWLRLGGTLSVGSDIESEYSLEQTKNLSFNEALVTAIDDEYKARATYAAVIETYGEIKPFSNIIQAEEQHIASLKSLFQAYGVPIPDDPWSGEIEISGSISELCAAGVQAEIDNATLYREQLLPAVLDYADITQVFTNLMNASQNNHLSAFERCS